MIHLKTNVRNHMFLCLKAISNWPYLDLRGLCMCKQSRLDHCNNKGKPYRDLIHEKNQFCNMDLYACKHHIVRWEMQVFWSLQYWCKKVFSVMWSVIREHFTDGIGRDSIHRTRFVHKSNIVNFHPTMELRLTYFSEILPIYGQKRIQIQDSFMI